jgi:glycosyltransferase involved in cell wall biosynthesis
MQSSSPEPRIGMLSWDFAAPRGGLGRAMRWLVDGVRSEGVSVNVFSPAPGEDEQSMLRWTLRKGGNLLFSLCLPFILQRRIDAQKIDILILPTGPGGIFLLRKPKRCRIVAMSYHTYWQQSRLVPREQWKWFLAGFEKRTFRKVDRILYASNDTRSSLQDDYGLDEKKLRHIVPIFPLDAWTALSAVKIPNLCVCVGRLDGRKGIEMLVKAWPDVVARCGDAQLILVGRGRLRSLLTAQRNPSIRQVDALPFAELQTLIAKASLALCPSYLEGFGLFAVEAMAAGTALIASDAEGLRRLVRHGDTGWLVRSGDADAWSESVVALLNDDALRTRLSQAGKAEMIRRLDQKRALSDWMELLRDEL